MVKEGYIMPVVVKVGNTTFQGFTMLNTDNQQLENEMPCRNQIPFRMVISNTFTTGDVHPVAFSDDANQTIYPVIDRLNKPVLASELIRYAGTRRCIDAVYNRFYKVIRICSPMCPIALTPPTTK